MTDNDIIILTESSEAPTKVGNRWLVTIARPGKGSTGIYSEEVLKTTGPTAFPKGTKAFFNHDAKRDVRDMVGTYDQAFWNEETAELQAFLTPFPRYATVLDEAGENIEASIHAAARKDVGSGIVRELVFDRSNTVDLVAFAGLEGSGLKRQVESLFAAAADEDEKKKENQVDEKQIEALTSAITALTTKFDTFVAESAITAQGVADEAAVESAVATRVEEALDGYADTVAAIDAADVPSTVKESLKVAARKGDDVTESLASAVSIVAEARKEMTPDPKTPARAKVVVVSESSDSASPKTYSVPGWKRS